MIEEDIFSAFKVLDLDIENFDKFLDNENNKSSWRYLNLNISTFFFYKYQANSMITFKNMKEFTDDELKFLNNSSPILHQQSIIPRLELKRLKNEFKNFINLDPSPNFLILNADNNFYEISKLDLNDYCLEYKGKITYYINKKIDIDVKKQINEKKPYFFFSKIWKGGAGNSVFKLCNSLNKKKYNIYIICMNHCAYEKEFLKQVLK